MRECIAFNAFVANGHLDGGRVWVRLTNRDQACVSLIQSATGERWMAWRGGDVGDTQSHFGLYMARVWCRVCTGGTMDDLFVMGVRGDDVCM